MSTQLRVLSEGGYMQACLHKNLLHGTVHGIALKISDFCFYLLEKYVYVAVHETEYCKGKSLQKLYKWSPVIIQ